jgi:hypothetical protein
MAHDIWSRFAAELDQEHPPPTVAPPTRGRAIVALRLRRAVNG